MRVFLILFIVISITSCRSAKTVTNDEDFAAVREVLSNTLEIISGPAGVRDFEAFKNQFTDDASIGISQDGKYFSFTPQQYEQRNGPYFLENDFYEKEQQVIIQTWKGIAEAKQVYYIYNGSPEYSEVDMRGINFYRLVKIDSEWKIQSIVFSTYEEGDSLPF